MVGRRLRGLTPHERAGQAGRSVDLGLVERFALEEALDDAMAIGWLAADRILEREPALAAHV